MKKYIQALNKDVEVILDIVQSSIKNVYPRYYPKEVVNFFCELHCRDNHITRVYVKPEYQRKGYGSYIIMDCLETIISKQYDKAVLDASLPAIHLYEKRGYSTSEHCRYSVANNVEIGRASCRERV